MRFTHHSVPLLLTSLCLIASSAWADPQGAPNAPTHTVAPRASEEPLAARAFRPEPLYDITLGKTLGETVQSMKTILGSRAQFAVDETLLDTPVPTITLRRVNIYAMDSVLQQLIHPYVTSEITFIGDNPDDVLVQIGPSNFAARDGRKVNDKPILRCHVVSLALTTADYGADTNEQTKEIEKLQEQIKSGQKLVIDAIHMALEMRIKLDGDAKHAKMPDLKLHPESGLLFVMGTPADQAVIESVIRGAVSSGAAQGIAAPPSTGNNVSK